MRSLSDGTMRVLLISGSYPPIKCGIGNYTALLTAALARSGGIAIGVLTSSGADAEGSPEGVEVLPLLDNWRVGNLFRLLRVVRDWRPNLIHIQYPSSGYGRGKMPLLLPLLLGRGKAPVVQTWHEPLSWLRGVRYLPCAITRDALITVEQDMRPLIPSFIWRLLSRKRPLRHIPVGALIPETNLSSVERETLQRRFGATGYNLIVYFGFAIPSKGVETLFAIADPATDRLVLLCELDPGNDYHQSIASHLASPQWEGKAISTGFLATAEVARVLAAADAAVFPFPDGMTLRNTSVYAAQAQGTFVLTTSRVHHGYDERENTYYALPGDQEEMRVALHLYSGRRGTTGGTPDWEAIAAAHLNLYEEVLTEKHQGK